MDYLCSQRTPNFQIYCFMFGWSIYRLFVLIRGWKRDPLQIMIFVYVCATCSVGELKARFEACKERNEANSVSLFHLSYLITLMAFVCLLWTPNVQINYFILEWSLNLVLVHILNNRHEFGPAEQTLKLLKPCTKGTRMNCWEALYMQLHHRRGTLVPEQQVNDTNPLFDLAYIPRDLQHIP
jgi:hypothetical protein